MYISHLNHEKESDPHYLADHVNEMLELVEGFSLEFDRYGMTKASVLLHDVGKKSMVFQRYIMNEHQKRGAVQHAIGGAYALHQKDKDLSERTRVFSNLVQLIVASHHTGLANFDKRFFDKMKALPSELSQINNLAVGEVNSALALLDDKAIKEVFEQSDGKLPLYISILVRFVMSALVDADYLSTEAYFSKKKSTLRQYDSLPFKHFQELLDKYVEYTIAKTDKNTLNDLRRLVQQKALYAGKENHSFYTLHAPTGTGKTIASLKFAIQHAIKFNKKRIITVLPLINLTEEVSSIYREIFGKSHVVEDHSSTTITDVDDGQMRLVAENWDRKFVVSTTVQLFESLFHHRPMKLRKLHRIANSVLIIDEYHQLPHHVLKPIFQVLDILQTHFNVTVLFISATPFPLLESKKIKNMNLIQPPKDIVNYESLFTQVPKRVKYEWEKVPLSLTKLASLITKEQSVLVIVNTRKEAQQLYRELLSKDHSFDQIYHLSTTLCSYHRNKVIQEIKFNRSQSNKQKRIAVISTSIMEAGIDISFPTVYRMIAPLDSIVQAAGRCNRNHEANNGRVVLFENTQSTKVNDLFASGINQVKYLIKEKGLQDFTKLDSFVTYYKRMLHTSDLNKYEIDASNCLLFRDVSKSFKMIEDNRLSVLCPTAPGFDKNWLKETPNRDWWEKVQSFTVAVPRNSQMYKFKNGIAIWKGSYDDNLGITL